MRKRHGQVMKRRHVVKWIALITAMTLIITTFGAIALSVAGR